MFPSRWTLLFLIWFYLHTFRSSATSFNDFNNSSYKNWPKNIVFNSEIIYVMGSPSICLLNEITLWCCNISIKTHLNIIIIFQPKVITASKTHFTKLCNKGRTGLLAFNFSIGEWKQYAIIPRWNAVDLIYSRRRWFFVYYCVWIST